MKCQCKKGNYQPRYKKGRFKLTKYYCGHCGRRYITRSERFQKAAKTIGIETRPGGKFEHSYQLI